MYIFIGLIVSNVVFLVCMIILLLKLTNLNSVMISYSVSAKPVSCRRGKKALIEAMEALKAENEQELAASMAENEQIRTLKRMDIDQKRKRLDIDQKRMDIEQRCMEIEQKRMDIKQKRMDIKHGTT